MRFEARHVLVTSSATASFAAAGPNAGSGARPRRAEQGVSAGGSSWSVLNSAPSDLLGRFAQWAGTDAPSGAGLWHLLTDAFPPPGVVGIASVDVLCASSHRLEYRATSTVAPAGTFPRSATGYQARDCGVIAV